MSVDVSTAVWQDSRATNTTLLVLLALADVAHHDGVCWPTQDWIAGRSRCHERTVRAAIDWLVEVGELQRAVAQRGRVRHNVYRVVVGRIGELPIDYERLPFRLREPFGDDRANRPLVVLPGGATTGHFARDDRAFRPRRPGVDFAQTRTVEPNPPQTRNRHVRDPLPGPVAATAADEHSAGTARAHELVASLVAQIGGM